QDGVRIERLTCAYVELPSAANERMAVLERLREARLLIGFVYSTPQRGGGVFLANENSAMFVFHFGDLIQKGMVLTSLVWQDAPYGNRVKRIDDRQIPTTDLIPGYTGIRNEGVHFWVVKGSRIFPELPHFAMNIHQELYEDFNSFFSSPFHWAFGPLI